MTTPSHRPIDYSHYFPWTRLFRSFRIATDPRKLILAALGLTVFWAGDSALSLLPFAPDRPAPPAPWNSVRPTLLLGGGKNSPTFFQAPAAGARSLANRMLAPVRPLTGVVALPFARERSWADVAWAWTRLFWALAVWSIFGGAIARLAALEFARDERGGLWTAVKFAARRFVSIFSAPLLPLTGVFLLWALCALGGLFGRIPVAGEWIVAASWVIAAAVALLVALVVLATVAGWPLMVAAVAAENSDAFDGFSRSFSYLYGRPWQFVGCAAIGLLFGVLIVAFLDTVAVATAGAAARMVATGMGESAIERLHATPPGYFASAGVYPFSSRAVSAPVSQMAALWLGVLAMIAIGAAVSYFWTAATVIYFLLRRADDATHFDEVWIGATDDEDDLLPLAGIASSDQPVTERSHHPTVKPPATTA